MFLRIFNIFLTILVLIGAVGLPVNQHFCKGELKSTAIFFAAEKCHKDQLKPHCPFHSAPDEDKEEEKGCCDDKSELVQIDDQERTVLDKLSIPAACLPEHPPRLFTYLAPHPRPRKNTSFENYRPPPLIPDPVREFQVLRI